MSVRAAQHGDMQHAGHFDIADVQNLPGYLLLCVLAEDRLSDD
jgi:hypothetical protein